MSLTDHKITDNDISTKGVSAAPDKLTGSASENKALFDRLIREAVKEKLNDLIDELAEELMAKMPAPASMGADGQYLKSDGQGGVSWDTPAGGGDMLMSVYDTDEDGRVDEADEALTCSGNAATATKLATARTLTIKDNSQAHAGAAASFDGSGNIILRLPGTLTADLIGNVTGDVTGNVSGSATKLKTARNIRVQDNEQTHSGPYTAFDGSSAISLRLPATISANVSGSAATAAKLGTARTFLVKNGNGNKGTAVDFDGSGNVELPMPTTLNITLGTTKLNADSYGDSLPETGSAGQLFFLKKVST